jgi:deoxyadenosine/deoxycytidine kinase/nucleoside 2-deoxyribosyltransferase
MGRTRRLRAYYAAGLFNEGERYFNLQAKAVLDDLDYEVWFPQEDAGFIEQYLAEGLTMREARQRIFEMNLTAVRSSDVLVFNLDGRVPDEGACVEAGIAFGSGIRCIGLQTDFRAVEPGGNNLMLDGILDYEVATSLDELRAMLEPGRVEIDLTNEHDTVIDLRTPPVPYVAVSGPLGVGKTTLIELMSSRGNWRVLEEPVDENPYLGNVYANLPDLGFRMQAYYLGRRAQQHRQAASLQNPTLQERCILDDVEVFFPAYRDHGAYDDNDYETLMSLYAAIRPYLPLPDLVVSLEAPLEVTVDRIRRRDRAAERSLDTGFIQRVHDYYRDWLSSLEEIPVVSIDTTVHDLVSSPRDQATALAEINEALTRASVVV